MKKKALVLAVYVACSTTSHAAEKNKLNAPTTSSKTNYLPKTFSSKTASFLTHKVRSGENLSVIAKRYKAKGISLNRMMKSIYHVNPHAFLNHNKNKLKAGVVLHIPSANRVNKLDLISAEANADYQVKQHLKTSNPKRSKNKLGGITYRVKRGDTLSKITKQYMYQGVSFTRMMTAIFKINPSAFSKNKINKLKVGALLRIPTYIEVAIKKDKPITKKNVALIKPATQPIEKKQKTTNKQEHKTQQKTSISTAEKLQQTITKTKQISYPKIKSKQPKEKSSDAVKTYSKEDLADLYKKAFGGKISTPHSSNKVSNTKKETDDSTSSTNNLAALYAKAFGKKPVSALPAQVSVDLRVNKIKDGEVTVFSNGMGEMDKVDSKQLLIILKKVLKDHIYKRLEKNLAANKKIAIKKLEKQGIKADYNAVNLSLDLSIKAEQRKPKILSLIKKRAASVRSENKIIAEDISGFINLYSNINIDSGEKLKTNYKMKLEGSLNIKNTVLETTLDYNGSNWRSGKTTLTYDKPDKLQRFVLGDISTGNRNFQENLKLSGLRTSKAFFMDPDLQIRPRANESFILETESEVEVYTNNQLRQRFYLDKGVYSLEDIGLSNGENNIKIKITDAFGKVTTKTSQQYYDSHLLKPDLSLYSFSVGYLNNSGKSLTKTKKSMPVLSAYYERGISKNLTMSFDAQINTDNFLLGTEAITSLSLGSLKQSFAVSGGKNKKPGFASRFEFKPNIYRDSINLDTLREDSLSLDQKVKRFVNSWSINAEYRNKDFAMISQNLEKDKTKRLQARLQTQFSFDYGNNWRGSLNLGASEFYDNDKKISVDLAAIKRFKNGGRVRLGLGYDNIDDFSVNLQLSIPLFKQRSRSNKSLEILANSKENALSSKFSVSPQSQVGKRSIASSLAYERDDKSNRQRATFSYRNVNYETKLSAINIKNLSANSSTNSSSNPSAKGNQQINLGINTSLACIGIKCATSYPINDSFALVGGPSNQNKPIAVNKGQGQFSYSDNNETGLPDDYLSVISGKQKNAVLPLESYRFQNINIDETALPDGYDSEKTEFEVFPRYHQGFLVKAGGNPATRVSGALIDKNKKILAYKGGQWVPLNKDGKTIAFFSNKIGQFRMNSVPAGRYKLELFDYPDMNSIVVTIPDKKGQLHELGNIIIATQ